mgnify:CR=1 FL=1
MAEEKKEVVEEKPAEKKEKKENGFSKFFKKRGKSISDSNRESKLEAAWKEKSGVQEFTLYVGNSAFNTHSYYGTIDEEKNEALVYGKFNESDFPAYGCILSTIPADRDKELPKRFYVAKIDNSKMVSISIEENGDNDQKVTNTYERPATLISLDPSIREVQVIKVGNSYYEQLKK